MIRNAEDMPAAISGQMVRIPAGEVTLRDDRTKQVWKVNIPPFLLSSFPVTQEVYFAVTGKDPALFKGSKRPVENVSWKDAIEFCNLLSKKSGKTPCYYSIEETEDVNFDPGANGYRLPSEAEWQYACQAGSMEARYGALDDIAWYKENAGGETHEAGLKQPNSWGLYDMLGNVWEWCSDVYDETIYGSYRIFRGGGWNDEARGCLATNRRRSHPVAFKIDDLGFRIAGNNPAVADQS